MMIERRTDYDHASFYPSFDTQRWEAYRIDGRLAVGWGDSNCYLLIKKKGQGQLSGDRLFSERPETTVLFNANISGFASLWPVVFIFQIVRKILKFKFTEETLKPFVF